MLLEPKGIPNPGVFVVLTSRNGTGPSRGGTRTARHQKGSSLFSVGFKPVGFISFHTVTKVGFLGHPDVARGLPGWGPISERSCSAVVRGCLPPINMWPGWVQSVSTAVRLCDGSCLRQSVSADVALSEKSPYLGGDQVRWVFRPPGGRPRTSWVGTNLRAVLLKTARNLAVGLFLRSGALPFLAAIAK